MSPWGAMLDTLDTHSRVTYSHAVLTLGRTQLAEDTLLENVVPAGDDDVSGNATEVLRDIEARAQTLCAAVKTVARATARLVSQYEKHLDSSTVTVTACTTQIFLEAENATSTVTGAAKLMAPMLRLLSLK